MCCCKSFGLQHLKESDLLMQKAGTDRAQLHYFHLIVYSLIGSDEAESAAGGLLSHSCSYPFSDMKWPKIGTTQYSAGGSFSNSLSFVCGHSFCLHTTPGERGRWTMPQLLRAVSSSLSTVTVILVWQAPGAMWAAAQDQAAMMGTVCDGVLKRTATISAV